MCARRTERNPPRRAVREKSRHRILAVDPGTRNVGVAVLELGRGLRPAVLHQGAIRTGRGLPISERLRVVYDALGDLLKRMQPDVVVVEEVFYGKNFKSALKIGEGRGVVLLAAAMAGREVVEYAPASVKQAICGNGRAGKLQVQRMITRLLTLESPPESADAADALALAFCHAQRIRGVLLGSSPGAKNHRGGRKRKLGSLQDLVDGLDERPRRRGGIGGRK